MSTAPLAEQPSAPPSPRTPLVGRAQEVASARALLLDAAVPLLTLTGPGGVGKTRLAVAVARDVSPSFADGAVFVDLSPLRDPAFVLPAVAQAVGVRGDGAGAARVVAALRPRQLLLVLDNCEHLLDAVPQFGDLLAACPALQILATSRAPLRLREEHLLPVPPLVLPVPAVTSSPAELRATAAVELFVARARAADPWGVAHALVGLAAVAAGEGRDEQAAWLLGAAESLRASNDYQFGPELLALRDEAHGVARSRLGEAGFAAAWEAGRALPLDDAVALALSGDAAPALPAAPPMSPPSAADALTKREREVLALLVQRWTDKEIAGALFLSPRTVTTHVTNIFNKLGVNNRREAAAVATRRGLV